MKRSIRPLPWFGLVWFLGNGLLMLLLSQQLYAQQDPIWTMYMFNRELYNPAFAGSRGGIEVTFAGRSQWVGIEGAPQTFALVAHGASNFLHGGIGGYVLGDRIGPFSTTEAKAMYAYHGKIRPKQRQSAVFQAGINGGLIYKTLDGTNWRPPQNPNDVVLINEVVNQAAPDLGIGFALVGPANGYYLSVSVNHLLEPALTNFTRDVGQEQSRLRRALVASAGFRWYPDKNVIIEPSLLVRNTGPSTQFEVNTNLDVNPVVLGISYRLGDAFAAILGFQASEKLFVGYSYDYTVSELSTDVSGSHEILIRYSLPAKLRLFPPNLTPRDNPRLRGGFN